MILTPCPYDPINGEQVRRAGMPDAVVMVQSISNSTTFPTVMRWFLIQIAYNMGNVVQTDKAVRINGAPLSAVAIVQSISNANDTPLFFKNTMLPKSGFEMCFDIGSHHVGWWGHTTSRSQND